MDEKWSIIDGTDNRYMVSSTGRLARLIGKQQKTGYALTRIMIDGEWLSFRVHKLVAEAFLGPIPEGYVVHHIDGNPGNNTVENLQIMPEVEHARLEHGPRVLTLEERADIKMFHRKGRGDRKRSDFRPTMRELADFYGVSVQTIYNIQNDGVPQQRVKARRYAKKHPALDALAEVDTSCPTVP